MTVSLCCGVGMMVIEMLLFIIRESIAETRAIATERLKKKRTNVQKSKNAAANVDIYNRKLKAMDPTNKEPSKVD
jgi:hypothetical protein